MDLKVIRGHSYLHIPFVMKVCTDFVYDNQDNVLFFLVFLVVFRPNNI